MTKKVGSFFAQNTLKIEFLTNYGKLSIDVDTVYRLELIKTASMKSKDEASSLYGILNTCVTKLGKSALRAAILEPMADMIAILDRQNCIEELTKVTNIMHEMKIALQKFQDIHKLMKLPYVVSVVT